jgi:hypothetical protein
MKTKKLLSKNIREVQRQLTSWRETRTTRGNIPAPLWDAAVELAREEGVSPVAQALRLDYYGLKRRVLATGTKNGHPGFVELQLSPSAPSSGCTVELEDGHGVKMTVRLNGGSTAELVALAQTFWRRQR